MRHNTIGRLALIVSLLALVIATSGTSYAAIKIGTKQIKNGAVTTKKLHNNAVISKKIRDNSVTGHDVNESTLGTVPSADSLSGGIRITKVDFRTNNNVGSITLFSGNGLEVRSSCNNGNLTLVAESRVNGATIITFSNDDSNPETPKEDDREGSSFNSGTTLDLLAGDDGDIAYVEFGFHGPNGEVVIGTLYTDEGNPNCQAYGFITAA